MYTVIRDTREQKGWTFPDMEVATLKTGDYTLKGFETEFVIERKANTGELAANIVQKRFERELQRMMLLPSAYLICEFDMNDILDFPERSGIPKIHWPELRIKPKFILKRLHEFEEQYNVHIILAGKNGKQEAVEIFNAYQSL